MGGTDVTLWTRVSEYSRTRNVYARTTYSREGESYNPKRPTPIRADSEGPTRLFEGSLESTKFGKKGSGATHDLDRIVLDSTVLFCSSGPTRSFSPGQAELRRLSLHTLVLNRFPGSKSTENVVEAASGPSEQPLQEGNGSTCVSTARPATRSASTLSPRAAP